MTWKEGQDVTFENGLVADLDNYKIDEHLYKEIPQNGTSIGGTWLIEAIKKSGKLGIRQSARIADSVRRFDRKSTILSICMIAIILFQSAILVVQLIMLFGKK